MHADAYREIGQPAVRKAARQPGVEPLCHDDVEQGRAQRALGVILATLRAVGSNIASTPSPSSFTIQPPCCRIGSQARTK